ncbi:hypothetical protein ACF0H5_017489 [Mactra antiquata]
MLVSSYSLVVTILMTSQSLGSLYDPHLFPQKGPFFEGWYMRIIDYDSNQSYGLLFGSVLPTDSHNVSGPLVLASILMRRCEQQGGCKLMSVNGEFSPINLNITARGKQVTKNPDTRSPPDFKWMVNSKNNGGYLEQKGETTTFTFKLGELAFRGEATKPVPWNSAGTGPEGWLVYLPLPLHWFVYSLRSELQIYEIENTTSGAVVSGSNGVVHLEKNWGNSFPKRWIWSEGVSSATNATINISGGLVELFNLFSVDAYLIGIRDPQNSLALDLRPDNSVVSAKIDGCGGRINMSVNSISYNVEIEISAKAGTYSNCLLGPEVVGFRPVCVESYDATATITVSTRSFIPFLFNDEKKYTIANVALEFGGSHVCNDKCS